MRGFARAHGLNPGPLQRPLLAGGISGLVAAFPTLAVLMTTGTFDVAAQQVLRLTEPAALAVLVASFSVAGVAYAWVFRRAANDRRLGWLLGLAFGFLAWTAAPVTILPLLAGAGMAAGPYAVAFAAAFLIWGAAMGAVFPLVHRPLQIGLERQRRGRRAKDYAASPHRLLRYLPQSRLDS